MKLRKSHRTIYDQLIGHLVKKGKKQIVKKSLDSLLFNLSFKLNKPIEVILVQIFANMNCFVESKTIKVRKNTYVIPFGLNLQRQNFLKLK